LSRIKDGWPRCARHDGFFVQGAFPVTASEAWQSMTHSRHCERSVAVQQPEFAVMDGRASLAMTGSLFDFY
jgi:hypothetical protein